MTKEKIEELAIEETGRFFLELESTNQSYFWGIVKKVTDEIMDHYALDAIGSEKSVRELMVVHLEDINKTLNNR